MLIDDKAFTGDCQRNQVVVVDKFRAFPTVAIKSCFKSVVGIDEYDIGITHGVIRRCQPLRTKFKACLLWYTPIVERLIVVKCIRREQPMLLYQRDGSRALRDKLTQQFV